jgi:chromosome segregation ATPase
LDSQNRALVQLQLKTQTIGRQQQPLQAELRQQNDQIAALNTKIASVEGKVNEAKAIESVNAEVVKVQSEDTKAADVKTDNVKTVAAKTANQVEKPQAKKNKPSA